MPPKTTSKVKRRCEHTVLKYCPTSHTAEVGYKQPTLEQRNAATTPRGTIKSSEKKVIDSPGTFPAPLVLPEDYLALDPSYPPQSLRSWMQEKYRNKITPERNTIYLAAPPTYSSDVEFAKQWTQPRQKSKYEVIEQPNVHDVLQYLEAFYHGMEVKLFPPNILHLTSEIGDLDDISETDKKQRILGLHFKESYASKGIRTRPRPKGDFTHQINLNDLLVAAIWALPEDAYALLMLVEHDLFEDEDDEFVCGRAYGGSRVAVISTARYNPVLDKRQGVEREHAWPASHCSAYLDTFLNPVSKAEPRKRKRAPTAATTSSENNTPIKSVISTHHSLPNLNLSSPSSTTLTSLWLTRVTRTVSHELGHCFGMDHCVYYACSMQGSASIIEDARQPPYLCPVDLAKLLHATGADMRERYEALLGFCERYREVHLFAAYGAWIRGRLRELGDRGEEGG